MDLQTKQQPGRTKTENGLRENKLKRAKPDPWLPEGEELRAFKTMFLMHIFFQWKTGLLPIEMWRLRQGLAWRPSLVKRQTSSLPIPRLPVQPSMGRSDATETARIYGWPKMQSARLNENPKVNDRNITSRFRHFQWEEIFKWSCLSFKVKEFKGSNSMNALSIPSFKCFVDADWRFNQRLVVWPLESPIKLVAKKNN